MKNQYCNAVNSLLVQLPKKLGYRLKTANKITGANLYKYRPNGSVPLILTIFSYCEAFQISPSWLIRLAILVVNEKITEVQAIEILSEWKSYEPIFDTATELAVKRVIGIISEKAKEKKLPL